MVKKKKTRVEKISKADNILKKKCMKETKEKRDRSSHHQRELVSDLKDAL